MSTPSKPIVLCVDDDPDILDLMKPLLTAKGYQVLTASNGMQALTAALRDKPDVVLLDVTMPDMNGYDVCARLQEKQETAYIPVVMVTALTTDKDKLRALRAGAADYLTKPFEPVAMLTAVESQLKTSGRWKEFKGQEPEARTDDRWDSRLRPAEFTRFKEALGAQYKLDPDGKVALGRVPAQELYSGTGALGITSKQVVEALSEFLKIPYAGEIDPATVRLGVLPTAFCKTNYIVALTDPSSPSAFVLSNPFNWEVLDAIRRSLERGQPAPKLTLTEPQKVENLLDPKAAAAKPPGKQVEFSEIEAKLREEYKPEEGTQQIDAADSEESAPVIQLVNNLIDTAYARGSSDIHIEPGEEEVVVRYRIDGDLTIVNRLRPARLIQPVVARLKIMSGLDISERRLPQDGRIRFKQYSSQGKDFDLRVAIAPQNHGEKVVMRIIDKQKSVLPLEKLGFSPRNLALYREKIAAPYGMVLHVGPTGSGKSMTLYAALNEVKNDSINIQTAEDPIEYTLPGINQLQTKKEIGLTFSRALRSFLRLDPDVILVGEIRDHETAEIAIEASLTGHLLLSTLHTNDAPSTVTRFIEMGIEPYMVSSSLLLVCAQRLLRRLCPECKEAYTPDPAQHEFVGGVEKESLTLYRPKGCAKCGNSGYKGRTGIHEILVPNDPMRAAIVQKGITAEALKKMAVDAGMTT
ncbi:MAG TPA: ATPase, T2SS/T4P/T4SS family, partial [Planctomycetota bacterium]|nr:ATPase, T2SS/T4P/T4SS family [Planctomycetota bacterium]